ncbi:MAG: FprA family A-type flavoprotein [Eubacteriales bacterium]
MSTAKITENICSIGVQNPALRVFDIIMQTEYGTSYNAYIVKGTEKTALIETVHLSFFDEYIENISTVTDIKKIDYLILNHTEPDHSGSVKKLLKLNPNITVVASNPGHKYLAAITNTSYKAMIAKDGDVLDLGGITLKFFMAPLLHWPDSMFTWCEEEKALFSCDFLGAHYCEPRVFDSKVTYPEKYETAFQDYYNAIFSPFKPFVLAGLTKMENLGAKFVCTSHGPVLTGSLDEAIKKYRAWSSPAKDENAPKKILLLYVSAYGCTKRVAEELQTVLGGKFAFETEIINVLDESLACIKEKIDACDGILLGTPTINRDALKPMWDVTCVIDAIQNKGKPAGVFGSYGWSGEGVPMLVERLKGLKLNVIGEGLRVNFVPSEDELTLVREYAESFAQSIK